MVYASVLEAPVEGAKVEVQNMADVPKPSVVIPPGSEHKAKNAPLECVTCHH